MGRGSKCRDCNAVIAPDNPDFVVRCNTCWQAAKQRNECRRRDVRGKYGLEDDDIYQFRVADVRATP